MTGSTLGGNKVRKLEFLFADAISRGCDTVFTCGSQNSNHCRATSVAAREIGLGCYLFLTMKNDVVREVFVVCEACTAGWYVVLVYNIDL
jgi:1-aminocyclopropane-1-carboxylate deaminase/D-cysteine desulfhydrase-like pyridoxal-dependent ACC family enzyme